MRSRRRSLRAQAGFTLVEVLVAMFILLVGILGTVSMIDGANARTNAADTRVGAVNLARQIIEVAHSVDYKSLTSSNVVGALRSNADIAGTLSGSTWVIKRHGESYTVNATACTYDNPRDGVATSHPNPPYCATSPSTSTYHNGQPDSNGDDFRRVEVTVSWTSQGGAAHSLEQSGLIVNPSGGLGPRITSMTPIEALVQDGYPCGPSPCQLFSGSTTSLSFNLKTDSPAYSVHWNASDGVSTGDVSAVSPGGDTSFTWNWAIGDPTTGLLDGTYTMNAQAFDDQGVPGDLSVATVMVNRSAPRQPGGLAGGWDTRHPGGGGDIVDLEWPKNPEGDIVGYRVYRDSNGNGSYDVGTDPQVCPSSGTTPITKTYCYDASPPDRATTPNPIYFVVAVDLSNMFDQTTLREGFATSLNVPTAQDTQRPQWNGVTLTGSVQNGLAMLTWSAPATPRTGGKILFYRIYRDTASTSGTPTSTSSTTNPLFSYRYDFTLGPTTTYSDPSGQLSHTYAVTAVDDLYNESYALGPVSIP